MAGSLVRNIRATAPDMAAKNQRIRTALASEIPTATSLWEA